MKVFRTDLHAARGNPNRWSSENNDKEKNRTAAANNAVVVCKDRINNRIKK